jgi:hypothetical protein
MTMVRLLRSLRMIGSSCHPEPFDCAQGRLREGAKTLRQYVHLTLETPL